jgi:alkylhydroperoxidase family enzyme
MITPTELQPLAPEHWDVSLHDLRDQLGAPPNLHATLANHPALFKAWMVSRNHMVHGVSVDRRDLEIVILRTAHHAKSDYEWTAHAEIALEYGLSSDEIAQLDQAAQPTGWSDKDQRLIAAADECAEHRQILSGTRDALLKHFNAQQLLDILFTIGMYTTLALMLKTLDVPIDDTTMGFSEENVDQS